MSYSIFDKSIQESDPALLFKFVQGVIEWRYTNVGATITHDGDTWIHTPVKMSAVMQSNEMAKDVLTLTFPRGHEFAAPFLEASPELVTSVTIYRGNLSDPDGEYIVYWKGRVLGATGDTSIAINCEPIFTSMKRPALRRRYQRLCPHTLYGGACGLDKANWANSGVVKAAAGFDIQISEAANLVSGSLIGGMVAYNGISRYVMNHVYDVVTLIRPIKPLNDAVKISGAEPVTMYFGCKHSYSDCLSKNNLDNYGGFPWIPFVNPFGLTSLV